MMRQGWERVASDGDGENLKMNILHPVMALCQANIPLLLTELQFLRLVLVPHNISGERR